jgi:RNA polymerase sigma factor for flagellar operon FliA
MGHSKEDIEKMWLEYKKSPTTELRNELIEEYLRVVKYIADRLYERMPRSVQIEDLYSAGVFGLMDAIETFDPKRGVKFEFYCMGRVRGSILDELRRIDVLPRMTRIMANRLEDAYLRLEKEFSRAPTDVELAKEMKISLKELDELMFDLSASPLTSMHRRALEKDQVHDIADIIDDKTDSYDIEMQKKDIVEYIKKNLSAKERYIITMYYFEELTFKEIGAVLGLSESRVSQLHAEVLLKLRAQLRKKKELAKL